jgi:hypothetical protein
MLEIELWSFRIQLLKALTTRKEAQVAHTMFVITQPKADELVHGRCGAGRFR